MDFKVDDNELDTSYIEFMCIKGWPWESINKRASERNQN
jgi:hypothetical protein